MTRSVIAVVAAAACVLFAGCGATSGIGSVPPSRYLVCQSLVGCGGQTPEHEPSTVYLSGDGSLYAVHITWTGWGTAAATGHGTAEANDCKPDCAQGTFSAHPVTITLTRPAAWHGDDVYTRAAYTIPSLSLHYTLTAGLLPGTQPSPPAPSAPAVPGPVSTQAAVTGSCSAGYEPAYAAASGGVAYGPFTAGQPSGYVTIGSTEYAAAAAYQVTLTDTGSTTAAVDGFVVAFYNAAGQELGSDQQDFGSPTYLTSGQGLTWTQFASADMLGNGLSGGATGSEDSNIPSAGFATCQLVEWLHP
jgi:hypothetical protein